MWGPALAAVSLEDVHIHDLRHTGNQFSTEAGANLCKLMERMGHDSTRAAPIRLVELRGLEPLTLCLQSTFTLSVTIAGLAMRRSGVRSKRRPSGLVVVSNGGQVQVRADESEAKRYE